MTDSGRKRHIVSSALAPTLHETSSYSLPQQLGDFVANDGNEAIAALDRQSFDVVLMDVQMPEMDGFEATRRIRQVEQASGKRMPGGLAHLQRLARSLMEECEKLMNDIRQGIVTGDAKLVERGAHTLKGSAGLFSAAAVVSAAERFESMGRQSNLEGTDEALADLEGQVSRLKSALAIVASSDSD